MLAASSVFMLSDRVEEAEKEYQINMVALTASPNNKGFHHLLFDIRRKVFQLQNAEAHHLSQLVKNKFIMGANRGSELFHSYIKRKENMNFISTLQRPDESLATS